MLGIHESVFQYELLPFMTNPEALIALQCLDSENKEQFAECAKGMISAFATPIHKLDREIYEVEGDGEYQHEMLRAKNAIE
jgi:hypothetical protein